MSALALVLCVSMLIGSTFAWFTDSVSNGINKIVSGNLDVELYHVPYYDMQTSQDAYENAEKVGPDTKLFKNKDGNDILWEPGAGAAEDFIIKNEGSLAFKYMLTFEFLNATATADGKTLKDILDITIWQIGGNFSDETYFPIDTKIFSEANNGLENVVIEGYLLPGEDIRFFTAINWNPSDHDNDFNVEGGLSLDIGVTLLATQYTYEVDGWDDQYDAIAKWPDISAQLASGGYVKLTENSRLETPIILAEDAVLDLNGFDIVVDNVATGGDVIVSDGAELTIKNGTLRSTADGESKAIIVSNTKAGTKTVLNLENVEVELGAPDEDSPVANSIYADAEDGEVEVNIGAGVDIKVEAAHQAPVYANKNATINMYDGASIEVVNNKPNALCVWGVYLDDDTSVFNMYGGYIRVAGTHSASGIYGYAIYPEVNIYGGTIDVETSGGYGIAVEIYRGSVNVQGGTFNIKTTGGYGYAFEQTSSLNLTVTSAATINVWPELNSKNTAYGNDGNVNPAGCGANIVLHYSAPVEVEASPLEEDFLFPAGTNCVLYKDMVLTGNSNIVHEETTAMLGLSGLTVDLDGGSVITQKTDSGICMYDCNITLEEGEKLITVDGAGGYQIFLIKVYVNGELLTNENADQWLEGTNWVGIYPEWP